MVDIVTLLGDVPELIALVQKVESEYAKLPPTAQRAPHDYVAFFNAIDEQLVDFITKVTSQIKSSAAATTKG